MDKAGGVEFRKLLQLISMEIGDTVSEEGQFLKLSFELPFSDSAEVEDCFVEDLMPLLLLNESVQKFTDFMQENYIVPNSPFSPGTLRL